MSNDTSAFQLEEVCLNSWFIIITNKQSGKGGFFYTFFETAPHFFLHHLQVPLPCSLMQPLTSLPSTTEDIQRPETHHSLSGGAEGVSRA